MTEAFWDTEYYSDNGENPYLIVSPSLRNAIVRNCPDAEFIPVQSSEQAR